MNTKGKICYDIAIKPRQIDFDRIFNICDKLGFLIYASIEAPENCHKPYPYMLDGSEMNKILVDISTKEGKKKLKEIEELENNIKG